MQIEHKWTLRNKEKNYAHIFVITFWIGLLLGIFNIIALICTIFIEPNDALNVQDGQKLFMGFYELIVGKPNIAHLTPFSIFLSIMFIIDTLVCIISYWTYRNSRFLSQTNNLHVSSVFIVIIIFTCILFLINVFNRQILEYKNIDIVNNGWNTDITKDNYIIRFNYVYDIQFINFDGKLINAFFTNSSFFGIWVILICIFFIILFVFIVTLFYNSSVFISFSRKPI